MKSWANPVVVTIREVVVVQVVIRIHIPHVVIVVSRTQPETKKDNREPISTPYIIYILNNTKIHFDALKGVFIYKIFEPLRGSP